MKIKKAIVLAAGFGARLHPLTLKLPKPLLKIGKLTLLENTLNFLKSYGVDEVIVNTFYLSGQIVLFLNKINLNIKVTPVIEKKEILGTGGGILNALQQLNADHFFVINPDTIWSQSYLRELEILENIFFEKKLENIILVANKTKSFDKSLTGDFNLNSKNIINLEKPNHFIYTGCQIFKKSVFNNLDIKPFPINEVWKKLINEKKLQGLESEQNFLHVTSLKVYNDIIKKF